MPALKSPLPSLATMAEAVFVAVAVVAELLTLPAVLIVANLVSTIPALASTSALTMLEVDKTPEALLCTTPAVLKGVTVTPVAAVMVPAVKSPDASRLTMAEAVFVAVAVVAELLTLPAVLIVANLVS